MSSDGNEKKTSGKMKAPPGGKIIMSAIAGVGGTMICYPLEVLKNHMQVSGEGGKKKEYNSTLDAVHKIVKNNGILALYDGISASILRHSTYTATRLGLFMTLVDRYKEANGKEPPALLNFGMSTIAGAIGGLVGLPADVAMTRMSLDKRQPPGNRKDYKHVFDALYRMTKEEGFNALFRGGTPLVIRAAVVNASQLTTYYPVKKALIKSGYFSDNALTHSISSFIAAVVATATSVPLEVTKTRLQNMPIIDGKPAYTGMVDVAMKIMKNENIFAFWKGVVPACVKNGPQTIIVFVILEKLNKLYNRYFE